MRWKTFTLLCSKFSHDSTTYHQCTTFYQNWNSCVDSLHTQMIEANIRTFQHYKIPENHDLFDYHLQSANSFMNHKKITSSTACLSGLNSKILWLSAPKYKFGLFRAWKSEDEFRDFFGPTGTLCERHNKTFWCFFMVHSAKTEESNHNDQQ